MPEGTLTTQTTEDRSRRRKSLVAWGALAGVAALITTAAFTDVARLNLGDNGIGGADTTYNIQVGATDANGLFIPGEWQEADGPAGVPIAISGAESIYPGSDPISVTIPVRNESPTYASSLSLSLSQLADDIDSDIVTDPDYLSSLRFSVSMPGTTGSGEDFHTESLTFVEAEGLVLNELAAGEESGVTISIVLLPQGESGAPFDDNSLAGKGAFLQATLDGSSL